MVTPQPAPKPEDVKKQIEELERLLREYRSKEKTSG